ncbi:MAG: family 20 glycosylhydrolase [Clostridia bacterium]|nr:family 20 glycosylhydrolase [Clostridia bacterium]
MWEIKGIVLTAPLKGEIDNVIKFIDEYLAPRGFNTVIMQVRYRYEFKKHPEVTGYDPLSYGDVKSLLSVCRKNNIKLIPKMNLMGHQSGIHNEPTDGILHGHNKPMADEPDGLLRAYPQFDEQNGVEEVYYSRSICLSNQEARDTVCELLDELMDVFEADSVHIGCDEGFSLGVCEKCAAKQRGELFASWINGINRHVRKRGGSVLMWGDRLLSSETTGYDRWEASDNGSYTAIDLIDKDITICDWHYNFYETYPSVDVFGEAGFKILICPWRDKSSLEAFLNYAKAHDKGHIKGILMTTWCGSGYLARRLLYGEKGKWLHTEQIASTVEEIFG